MRNNGTPTLNYFSLVFLSFVLFLSSCSIEEDSPYGPKTLAPSIGETTIATEELSNLASALIQADGDTEDGLMKALSNGKGPFTVFAPTNQAFQEFLAGFDGYNSLEDFDSVEKRAILSEILSYHIINSVAATSTDLGQEREIATRQGETVTINSTGGVSIQDKKGASANIITADIETRNGIVHIIDRVLLPDGVANGVRQDLVDLVNATDALSNLEAAVEKTDLADTLKSSGPFTVLAPTDDAFIALLNLMGDDYNSLEDFDTELEINLLRDILLYHVIPAEVLSTSFAEGPINTTLAENDLGLIASGNTFVVRDATQAVANITSADNLALNGIAHTINKVLLPQSAVDFITSINLKNIFNTLASQNQYSLLTDAMILVEDGIVELLSDENGSFTIFAPTNDAFRAFLAAIPDCGSLSDFDTPDERKFLASVLKYHVFEPKKVAAELVDGTAYTTVQGETLSALGDDSIIIDDATALNAKVTQANVDATNGVIHRIDKVLQPAEIASQLGTLE